METDQRGRINLRRRLIIRQVQKEDLPDLEWNGEYIHYRNLFAQAFQEAEEGRAVLWVCVLHTYGIIGQVFVQLLSQDSELADGLTRAYVHGVRIMPEHRNQGIGTALMNKIEKDLLKRGYEEIVLNVSRKNLGAIRLYKRLGFRITAADPGKWSFVDHLGKRRFVNEPAWRMKKLIT